MRSFTADVMRLEPGTKAECTVMAECPERATFKISVPLKGYDYKWSFYTCHEHIVRVLSAGAYSVAEY